MYGRCDKHNCEMTGFTTLFCPQCEKEKEAAADAIRRTGGQLLGVGVKGNGITYFAIVADDFPEAHSNYYHAALYADYNSVRTAANMQMPANKAYRIVEVEVSQQIDPRSFWSPTSYEEPCTFDQYRIHPDVNYQLGGTREARLVRVAKHMTAAKSFYVHTPSVKKALSKGGLTTGRMNSTLPNISNKPAATGNTGKSGYSYGYGSNRDPSNDNDYVDIGALLDDDTKPGS